MTRYFAIVEGNYIQKDLRNEQLEIYETKVDALKQCPSRCSVIEVDVVRNEILSRYWEKQGDQDE